MNKAHGEYKLKLSGNIMFTAALGPWNTECVEMFMQDYCEIILPMHGSRWGDLIILHGESLLIPAAEQLLEKAIIFSQSRGLSDVALVLSNSLVQSSAETQFLKVYKSADLNLQILGSEAEGLEWLIQQGLHCDNVDISRKHA